jgi:hypothetical protein
MLAHCPMCGGEVDWVNSATAARILGVGESRVRELLRQHRFPGAVLYKPPTRDSAFWKIPLAAVAALLEARSPR